MHGEEYIIVFMQLEAPDVYHIRLKPKNSTYTIHFTPGQFFHIKNQSYNPHETHPFSAITTAKTTTHIDFCMKICGDWTKAFLQKKIGESILLYGPLGTFTMNTTVSSPVFIAGGVGITPMLSIIQSIHDENHTYPVTLIYANKSPQTIIKKKLLEDIFYKKNNWRILFIYSQIKNAEPHIDYSGHITADFLRKEINLREKLTFFVCGTKLFSTNITEILYECAIDTSQIKRETFAL